MGLQSSNTPQVAVLAASLLLVQCHFLTVDSLTRRLPKCSVSSGACRYLKLAAHRSDVQLACQALGHETVGGEGGRHSLQQAGLMRALLETHGNRGLLSQSVLHCKS